MWITYSVYHVNQQQAFQLFQSSFFPVKMVNHCEGHVIFHDTEHELQQNILHHFLHYSFLWNLLNWEVSSTHSKPFTGSFFHITQPYKLIASQYLRYDHSLFLSCSFIYLLLTFVHLLIEWHIHPLVPFSIVTFLTVPVLLSVPFKAACHANPGA